MQTPSSDAKIITTLALVAIADTGASSIVYAATPMFVKVFPDPTIIGSMSSIYFIVGAIAAGLCGGIGDLYGRRATMIWVLTIVTVASIVAGSLSDPLHIVAAHAIQGVAIAGPTLTMGLIRENVSPQRVPFAIAIVTTATTATVGLFFLLAGYIMDHQSWRYIFYFGPVLLLPAILLLLTFIPRSRPAQRPRAIPVVNALLFGLAALFMMIAVGQLSQHWLAPRSLVLLAAGLAFLVGWIFNALHCAVPMVDVRMLGQRGTAAIMVVYALLSLTIFQFGHIMLFVGKAAPQDGYGGGLSATAIAGIMAPMSVLALLIGPLTGVAVQRYGHFKVFLASLCLSAAPFVLLLLLHHSYAGLLEIVIVAGLTSGALMPAFRIALQEEVDASRASSAMGLAELLRALCMGFGAQIVASALVHRQLGAPADAALDPNRFTLLMASFTVLMVMAAAIYAVFGSRQGKIGRSSPA